MPRPRAHTPVPRPLPPLLPSPRWLRPRRGRFALREGAAIVLEPGADERAFAAARALRDAFERRCGVSLAIEGHADRRGLGPHIALRVDAHIGEALPARVRGGKRLSAALAAQAYQIDIDEARVVATGGGGAGLRYAVQTLTQLADRRGHLPACRISDAPRLEWRGLMLDVSRGKVPRPEQLEWLVDLCVAQKLNMMMLYTEHTFRFRRHPQIGASDSPLDAETMRALDAYAAERFVELVPCLQSLGHMEHVLGLPRYRHLAESEAGWSLSPTVPESYALLRDLYDEYLPNFRSRLFNANCDEPWDLGRGKSAERESQLGPGGVFLEHVERLRELARARGKRSMIWADVVHAHPERIAEIDRDLILLDWWYEADFDYERVKAFADAGLEFVVCPGTSSWNALFPRVENSRRNISGWADTARRFGARGLVNTDWGDFGHYNLQGNSLFAYAWGAQESWSGPCPAADFDRAFSRLLFDDERGEVARLYRELGAVHDAGFSIFNGSALQYLFFDDLRRAYFIRAARPAPLRRAARRLEALRKRIRAALERQERDVLSLEEMLYAADASLFAVHKAVAGLEYDAWRRNPRTLRAAGRSRLAERLHALAGEQQALGRRLRRLWLARAQPSNLALTERRLRRSARSLRSAARGLDANRPGRVPEPEALTARGVLQAVRASLT